MLKVLAIVSVGLFSAVYWGVGALLNATMALWLVFFPVQPNTQQIYQQPSNVQLSGSVIQAQPSNLQVGENPQ